MVRNEGAVLRLMATKAFAGRLWWQAAGGVIGDCQRIPNDVGFSVRERLAEAEGAKVPVSGRARREQCDAIFALSAQLCCSAGHSRAVATSVWGKSLPLERSGSPEVFASAYEKQSPKFSAAGWRPLPYLLNASRPASTWSGVTATI
jgi:hypothetical protein